MKSGLDILDELDVPPVLFSHANSPIWHCLYYACKRRTSFFKQKFSDPLMEREWPDGGPWTSSERPMHCRLKEGTIWYPCWLLLPHYLTLRVPDYELRQEVPKVDKAA